MGHQDGDYGVGGSHAIFTIVTFYGGWILLAALLLGSYTTWRWNQPDH
jgi:hypothetical protein